MPLMMYHMRIQQEAVAPRELVLVEEVERASELALAPSVFPIAGTCPGLAGVAPLEPAVGTSGLKGNLLDACGDGPNKYPSLAAGG